MGEIRNEWETIDGITHGKNQPHAEIPTGSRPIRLDGYWHGAGYVTEPEQLADARIGVHPDAIERTWGEEGLARYEAVLAETGQISMTVAEQSKLDTVRNQINEIKSGQ